LREISPKNNLGSNHIFCGERGNNEREEERKIRKRRKKLKKKIERM
jgi:hypothetical protein